MNTNSPLATDLYQLTMAAGYWQLRRAEQLTVFQLTFRKNPFKGNYTIASGLAEVIDYLSHYHFRTEEIDYLRSLKSNNNKEPLFSKDFLDYLQQLKFSCDIDAIPEGTLMFPQQPLLRIKGPLLQCQLLETPLINLMNFSSLVATKAAQLCQLVQGDPIVEFGQRRAQGPNGALTAARASYIGGCESTSNVLAGEKFHIPVTGTQAHSWIMSYPDELTAFRQFVKVSDNTTLLVDTYDSILGVKNAIQVGQELRKQGRRLDAIRLDSGDLFKLSKKARQLLDKAGFTATKIIASGDLSAEKIAQLKHQRAPIDIWGVGTRLTTAYDQPSLDAVYKLTAIEENKQWQYKMKLSNMPQKITSPGIQQVRRYFKQKKFVGDVIYDLELGISDELPKNADQSEDLLVPIFRKGKLVYSSPSIEESRKFCLQQVADFTVSRVKKYPVTLEPQLRTMRLKLMQKLKNQIKHN